jgi:hypothetical protein
MGVNKAIVPSLLLNRSEILAIAADVTTRPSAASVPALSIAQSLQESREQLPWGAGHSQ